MQKERDPKQRRSVFLIGVVLMVFVGLVAQLGNLTLLQQQQYRSAAEGQHIRKLPVFAPRGLIYDRNMEPLATNRPANSVFVSYPYYKQPEVLQRLSTILKMPLNEIQAMVEQKIARQEFYEPILVKDDITPAQYATILERKNELPGVDVEAQAVRVYPNKDLGAHMIGYVGEISQEDLSQMKDQGYIGGEMIGQTGLEAFYESVLRGKPGVREVEINNYFQPLGETKVTPPQAGNSLVLTIDGNLQRVAERALDWDMWRIRNTVIGDGPWPNAKAGAVVVMDVKTGAILAMASKPGFDPNLFAQGISGAEMKKLQDPILTPMVDRAIQTAYQPGSTWKMMTSAAAMSDGVVGPYESVYCNGIYDKAGHPHDWTYPVGHGFENTVSALRDSCDIYFYELGYRLGTDRLVAKAQEFGFGAKTGIDLGGESPGFLPTAQNRLEIWDQQRNDPWSDGHTVSAAIGQIVQATPVQLVRYVASLGNTGKLMKPYLVQKVVDDQGRTVKEFSPQQTGVVSLKPEYLKAILDGMAAVDGPGGTSDYGMYPIPGLKTGGKTGSAEYPPQEEYGFFVSLAPFDNPQIAIAVAIERSKHGGSTGAVARAIESAFFNKPLLPYDPAKIPDEFPNDMAGLRRKYRVVGTGE